MSWIGCTDIYCRLTILTTKSSGDLVKPAEYLPGSSVCPGAASTRSLRTIIDRKRKSSARASGSPRHCRRPWPNGTKWSGLLNLPLSVRNLHNYSS